MLKPPLQGVDRGRAKLKLRVFDEKTLPSRDSIAFVSQHASPATYTWCKVDGVHNHESRLADLQIDKHNFANDKHNFATVTSRGNRSRRFSQREQVRAYRVPLCIVLVKQSAGARFGLRRSACLTPFFSPTINLCCTSCDPLDLP